METLLVRSSSSPFIYGADGIHSHFTGREVNQQLRYYQKLMEERKRGVAISALVDEEDRPGRISTVSSSLSAPSSAGLSPSPTSGLGREGRTLPSLNVGNISTSPRTASPDLDGQRPLPSFSTIDLNAGASSKLHDEIIARHSQGRPARPPLSVQSSEAQRVAYHSDRERALLGSSVLTRSPSHGTELSHSRSQSDQSSYWSPPGMRREASNFDHSSGPASAPIYEESPFASHGGTRLSPIHPSSPGSARPLSDILEKTHAQIASQRGREDNSLDRSRYGDSQTTPALPIHPGRGSSYPPPLLAERLSPNRHTTQPLMTALPPRSPQQSLYSPPQMTFPGHAPMLHPQPSMPNLSPTGQDVNVNSVAARKRRGNLPRDAVRLFKKWVEENKKHPYPNEAQKQEFERVTGLSMQQINNWFINARRRNLTPKEREDMKREKERQSESGSPASSRQDDAQDLPEVDSFSLGGPSRQGSHSRDHSMGGTRGLGYQ